MSDRWLEAKLYFKDPELPKKLLGTDDDTFRPFYKRLLLEFFGPLVDFGVKRGEIASYHFFFEPDPHVLIRLNLHEGTQTAALEEEARRLIRALNDFLERVEFGHDYTGEAAQYGGGGWRVAQDLFRVAADIAMARTDDGVQKADLFNLGKLIHCICNPVLGTQTAEMQLYVQRLLEMTGIAPEAKSGQRTWHLIPKR